MSLAENIRAARKRKGMTQEELGRRIGVAKQTIQKYENGIVTNIPVERLRAIATVLNVSATELMGYDEVSPVEQVQDELFEKRKLLFDLSSKATEEDLDKFIKMLNVMLGEDE